MNHQGQHILDKVNVARSANPEMVRIHHLEQKDVDAKVAELVQLFTKATENLKDHACVTLDEKDMGRTYDNNCYAQITKVIGPTTHFDGYEVAIGEKAYIIADYKEDPTVNPAKLYEFFLGPLFFGVYELHN